MLVNTILYAFWKNLVQVSVTSHKVGNASTFSLHDGSHTFGQAVRPCIVSMILQLLLLRSPALPP